MKRSPVQLLKKFTPFLIGQPLSQGISIVTGLLLVNQLEKSHYAYFSIIFAIQSAVAYVCDMGLASAVMAIGGRGNRDSGTLSALERAVTQSRVRMQKIMLPIASIVLFFVSREQGWSVAEQMFGYLFLFLAVYLQKYNVFQSILVVGGRLSVYYNIQIFSSLARLLFCLTLWKGDGLNGYAACTASLFVQIISSIWSFRAADVARNKVSPELTQSFCAELNRYQKPILIITIFSAFQSQVTTLLAGLFAAESAVADVAAFGRLAQVFAVFAAFNGNIVAPALAKAEGGVFLDRAGYFLLFSVLGCFILVVISTSFPAAFLFVLGKNYQDGEHLIVWIILSACVSHLINVIWTICSSKLWSSSRQSWLAIGATLFAQAASLLIFGVRDSYGAILCGVFGSIAGLIVGLVFCSQYVKDYRSGRIAC